MVKRKSDHLKLVKKSRNLPVWKKVTRFLFRLVLAAVLLVLLRYGETFFRVDEISVEGAEAFSSEEIIAASGIREGISIFLLQEQKISEKIRKQFPRIKEVKLNRNLPDAAVITVSERIPVGYVITTDGFWLIDQNAFCFANAAESTGAYPLISGITEELVIPGALLDCPIRREALQRFFAAWTEGIALEIAEINLDDRYNLIIYTDEGQEIWLGDGRDMESKIALIERSIPYINLDSGTHLDVRSGKRLVAAKSALKIVKEVDP